MPSAWWAGVLLPLGVGVWASFLYLGIKTRSQRWIIWSAAYLSAAVLAGCAGLFHARLAHEQLGPLPA